MSRVQNMTRSLEAFALRQPALASLAMVTVLFTAALSIFPRYYETNDDVVLAMLASGRHVASQPTPELVFSHPWVGRALNAAYTAAPDGLWYHHYLVLGHMLAAWALTYAFFLRFPPANAAISAGLLFAAVQLHFVVSLQFTTMAAMVAVSGFALALIASDQPNLQTWPRRGALLSAAMLLILAGLVRFQTVPLLAVVMLPVAAVLRPQSPRRAFLLRYGAVVVVSLACGVTFDAWHRQALASDPAWRDFLSLTHARSEFTDYGVVRYTDESRRLFEAAGLNQNDVHALCDWLYEDPKVFPAESLSAIVREYYDEHLTDVFSPRALLRRIAALRYVLLETPFWLMAAPLPLVICLLPAGRRERQALAAALLATACVVLGLLVFRKLPERVFLPLVAAWVVQTMLLATASRPMFATIGPTVFARFRRLATAAALMSLACHMHLGRAAETTYAQTQQDLAPLAELDEKLIVTWGGAFPSYGHVAHRPWMFPENFRFLALGWTVRTPINETTKREWGIDNALASLAARDDLLLMSHDAKNPQLKTFLREHYGVDVEFLVHTRTPSYTLYRVLPVGDPILRREQVERIATGGEAKTQLR